MSNLNRGQMTFSDADGKPLAGGSVLVMVANTTNLATTFSDLAETKVNPNPVLLDASGGARIYGTGNFTFTTSDLLGNVIPGMSGPASGMVSPAMQPVVEAPSIAAALGALGGSGILGQIGGIGAQGPLLSYGSGGYFTNTAPPAVVNYLGDRAFVGAAAQAGIAWDGKNNTIDGTWFEQGFPGFGISTQTTLASIDSHGLIGVLGASRSYDVAGFQVPVGGAFYAWNEAVGVGLGTVWGSYVDARRLPNTGPAIGIEVDATNLGTVVTTSPFNVEPQGATTCLWLAAGSGITAPPLPNPSSSAISILANSSTFQQGIVFSATGLSYTNGLVGLGTAISMANRQALAWVNAAGSFVGQIYSSTTISSNAQELVFTDGGLAVAGISGAASVIMPPTPNCVNGVTMQGAVAGGWPVIGTFGSGGIGVIPLTINPQGGGAVVVQGSVLPYSDNLWQCGTTAGPLRWSSIAAVNGVIQTSDLRQKTNIKELPPAIPLVMGIIPRTFKWVDGGGEYVTRKVPGKVPVTKEIEEEFDEHEVLGNGTARVVKKKRTRVEQIYDMLPVVDAEGIPLVEKGQIKVHSVQRMTEGQVEVGEIVKHTGRRTHWGFLAQEVKSSFDEIGMDFGGYVKGEDGLDCLRPDQLQPVLWKAVQELVGQVQTLAGQITELQGVVMQLAGGKK